MLKKELDQQFAENWYDQLDWIFHQSNYLEKAYLNYPVYRIAKDSEAAGILPKQ